MSRHAHCGDGREIVERSVSEQCEKCKAVGVPMSDWVEIDTPEDIEPKCLIY